MNDRTNVEASPEARAAGDAVADAIAHAADDAAAARTMAEQALEGGADDATLSQRLDDLEEGISEWHDRADDLEHEIQALETVQRQLSETIRTQAATITQMEAKMQEDRTPAATPPETPPADPNSSHGTPPAADTPNLSEAPPPIPPPASSTPQPASDAVDHPAAPQKRHRLI